MSHGRARVLSKQKPQTGSLDGAQNRIQEAVGREEDGPAMIQTQTEELSHLMTVLMPLLRPENQSRGRGGPSGLSLPEAWLLLGLV